MDTHPQLALIYSCPGKQLGVINPCGLPKDGSVGQNRILGSGLSSPVILLHVTTPTNEINHKKYDKHISYTNTEICRLVKGLLQIQ